MSMKIRTPYYMFDKGKFCSMIQEYLNHGNLFYPIKANDHPMVVSTLCENRCSFEVDSIEHMKSLVNDYGVAAERLLYSYPIREELDIAEAEKLGIRNYVVDSFDEYEKIVLLSPDASFMVRLNTLQILEDDLPPECDKWGFSIDDALSLIHRIQRDKRKILGISFYITAEVNCVNAFERVLNSVAKHFTGISVDYLNIGGGISLDTLKRVGATLQKAKNAVGAKAIILEPGRHLLNPCIDLIVSVVSTRNMGGSRFVFINAGIYHGLIDAVIKKRDYDFEDNKQSGGSQLVWSYVCGSSSDISDTLGKHLLRNDLAIGDQLTIKECGAYSAVMQTHFYGRARAEKVLKECI